MRVISVKPKSGPFTRWEQFTLRWANFWGNLTWALWRKRQADRRISKMIGGYQK
jgi:hypothetical protein